MQGRLRQESFEVEIYTRCACCNREMRLTVNTDLESRVHTAGAIPLVFEPQVDWSTFTDPSIIHRY